MNAGELILIIFLVTGPVMVLANITADWIKNKFK